MGVPWVCHGCAMGVPCVRHRSATSALSKGIVSAASAAWLATNPAQSLVMSPPLLSQIIRALWRISSTLLRTTAVEVLKAIRRRRTLNGMTDSRPFGAVLLTRCSMLCHRLKSKGFNSGDYRGQATVLMPRSRLACLPLPLLCPAGLLSSAIR